MWSGVCWPPIIGHMKDSLWSIELFGCESILLKSHRVMVVMNQFSRRIVGLGIHAGKDFGSITMPIAFIPRSVLV
jgi:putative transposase